MASKARLWSYWRRRLGLALTALLFVFLGYAGVVVTRQPFIYNTENAEESPLPPQELPVEQSKEPTEEEAKGGLSMQEARQAPTTPSVVLVLSSMPRGGSTLLTELLSSVQNSVAIFEPLWWIEKKDCYQDVACVQKYLSDILSCSFSPEFENWLKNKKLFFHYFSPEARRCINSPDEKQKECLKAMNLQERCDAAPLAIVKVIRARLSWIHNFLEDSLVNLKVIHLTRDPRGSLNSISHFGWESSPHIRCGDLASDMDDYEELHKKFPTKVTQVRYEHLCLKPVETASDIFHFLFDNATLPAPVTTFLDQHMLSAGKKYSSMSTFKNSSKEFEAWRYKIKAKFLQDIEEEPLCVAAIEGMGHALFGSHKAATDPKNPLILNNT